MSLTRLGIESDDLEMGVVTFRPGADCWFAFCSNPPEPHVAHAPTGKEAYVRLIRWVAQRRKVDR